MTTISPALPSGVVLGQPSASSATTDPSAYPTVNTIAALRAFNDTAAATVVLVLGYYAPADQGGGVFVRSLTDTTTADNGGTIIVDAEGYRWYRDTGGRAVTTRMFGCYADNTHYDDTAFGNFMAWCMTTGQEGFVVAGVHKFAAQIVIDLGTLSTARGPNITGAWGQSVLNMQPVTTIPPMLIEDSSMSGAAFYGRIENLTVQGNVAGPVVEIALASHTDAFNDFSFKFNVSNASTSTSAIGVQVNGLYNCALFIVANCAGHGVGMVVTELQFSTVQGGVGNADTGLHWTSGYTFGNSWLGFDCEAVNTCIIIDVATASNNTFIGGTLVWSNGSGTPVAAFNATNGSNNRFIGTNFGSTGAISTSNAGIIVYGTANGPGTALNAEIFGQVKIIPASGDADVVQQAANANACNLVMQNGGYTMWVVGKNPTSNTGSNVGSDYQITRYTDLGVVVDNPISIVRATGVTTITALEATTVGFFGASVGSKPTVTGSKGSNAALTSLLSALATLGLVTDSSS